MSKTSAESFRTFVHEACPAMTPVELIESTNLRKYFLECLDEIIDEIIEGIGTRKYDRTEARVIFLEKVKGLVASLNTHLGESFINEAIKGWVKAANQVNATIANN